MEFYNLFPTLVITVPNFLVEFKCKSIFNKLKLFDAKKHNAIMGGKSSYNLDYDILDHFGIKKNVQEVVDEYARKISIPPILISQSWFNIQDIDSILRQHNHPYSIISGALYINVDDRSSKLCFQNPNELACMNLSGEGNFSEYNSELFVFEPKNGDLVLFPSWLKHGSMYEKNQTPYRTVISFNTYMP